MHTVDLHLHTTASDGRLSPTALVNLLAERKLRFAAITDHDSTEGMAEALRAAEAHPSLTLIPGIELSADAEGGEVHVLGYFLKWENEAFQETLADFRRGRVGRARQMVDRLAGMGLELAWERVLHFAGDGSVGRPHIALALVEKGFVKDVPEAFNRYLGRGGPAYAERRKLTPAGAIDIIRGVGGAAVLAHPSWVDDLEERLVSMKEAGLAGMEVYYKRYSPGVMGRLADLAQRFDLIPCGGTDYHAMGAEDEAIPGEMGPPEETVERLRARCPGGASAGNAHPGGVP